MGCRVAHAEPDADAFDAEGAMRHQRHRIAVRIGEMFRPEQSLARDQQLAIAGWRPRRDGLAAFVDLQHRAEHLVAMLLASAAQRQKMIEGEPDFLLIEVEHRLDVIGEEADIDPWLGEVHDGSLQYSIAVIPGLVPGSRGDMHGASGPWTPARRPG